MESLKASLLVVLMVQKASLMVSSMVVMESMLAYDLGLMKVFELETLTVKMKGF